MYVSVFCQMFLIKSVGRKKILMTDYDILANMSTVWAIVEIYLEKNL